MWSAHDGDGEITGGVLTMVTSLAHSGRVKERSQVECSRW